MDKRFNNFRELLFYSAEKYSNDTLYVYKDNSKNNIIKEYRTFCKDVIQTANWLSKKLKGDPDKKICILSGNSYEYIVLFFACLCGSGVFTIINPTAAEETIQSDINKLEIDLVIYSDKIIENTENYRKICKSAEFFPIDEISDTTTVSDNFEFDMKPTDDMCVIIATSGTTSEYQKYVMLSADNILFVFNSIIEFEGSKVIREKVLAVLPLSHLYSLIVNVILAVYRGYEVIIAKNTFNIEKDLLEYEPTYVALVPLIAETLLKKLSKMRSRDPETGPEKIFGRNMRKIGLGGAMITPELVKALYELGYEVPRAYGMTESSSLLTKTRPLSEDADFTTVGNILPGIELKIEDGEIMAKAPSVMLGYYKNQELTEENISDGWLKTGDRGYITEDGKVYITGRKKNVIVLENGENIIPEELESRFMAIEDVEECGVFSPDDKKMCMVVKVRRIDKETENVIKEIDSINMALPYEKQIAKIEVSELELPKNSTGKIRRHKLKEFFSDVSILNQIRRLTLNILLESKIGLYDDFKKDLDMTSFDFYTLKCDIEDQMGKDIPKNSFMQCRCIFDVLECLHTHNSQNLSS